MSDLKDKLAGKSKKMVGKAMNNKALEARGRAQEEMGKMKRMFK